MQRQWRWLIVCLALTVSLGAAPQPQESVTYERYDVDIAIQDDGSLLVTETYQLRFVGEFREGFAEILFGYATDIVDVQVREGDRVYAEGGSGPGTFGTEREQDAIYVTWEFEPTSGTAVRAFAVEYRVLEGLWIYPAGDRLSWVAVPEDRGGIPVEASRVTVRFPQPVSPGDLTSQFYGAEVRTERTDERTILFEALAPIPDGTALEIEVAFPHGLTTAAAPAWQRGIDEAGLVYRWESLDVDLVIAADGALAMTEEHTLAVDEGYLYHGYRQIPWLYLDRVADVQVRQGERIFELSTDPCDYCYVVEEETGGRWVWVSSYSGMVIDEEQAGSTLVEWAIPAVVAGDTATFRLDYAALGAMRVFTAAQEIAWTVVFADRDVDVETASLRLHLPPDVDAGDVEIEGGETVAQPDGTLLMTRDGIPAGEAWSIRLRMPPGATTAQKSAWQVELERAIEEERAYIEAERRTEISRARWRLALGVLGCVLPVLGLVGMLAAWYAWGRDRPTPVVAQYLTEPPSDLPPGIVAYLVDEEPTVKGVLADLLSLAAMGLISVDLRKSDFTITLNWEKGIGEGETVQVADGEQVALEAHERTLFNKLVEVIEKDQSIPFSKIRSAFTRVLPAVYEQMGEAATQYFSMLPDEARRRWSWAGQRVVIVAVLLGAAGLCAMASLGPVACAPAVGLAVAGLMLILFSRWMPQRTTLGVEEAERWRAFRRYLESLKQYWGVEQAQAVLDQYFAYAVALDVEEVVLKQAERMGAQVPVWMVSAPVQVGMAKEAEDARPRRVRLPGGLGKQPRQAEPRRTAKARPLLAARPAGADLSLDGLAGSLGRSLDQAGRSLGTLLDAAVGEVDASPFKVVVKGAGEATKLTWKAGTSTIKVLGDILETSSSGGGRGGYGGGSSRRSSKRSSSYRSRSWSSSRSSRRSSSRSSSRSSGSSRRSSGGGRRGFK